MPITLDEMVDISNKNVSADVATNTKMILRGIRLRIRLIDK